MKATEEFKVVAVSENANSFGLRQMIMVAKDGTTCKACFNYLNVKEKGDTINAQVNVLHGKILSIHIPGSELLEMGQDKAPKKVVKAIFNPKK